MTTAFREEIQRLLETHLVIREDRYCNLDPVIVSAELWKLACDDWNSHFSKDLTDFCWITPYNGEGFIVKYGAVRLVFMKKQSGGYDLLVLANCSRNTSIPVTDLVKVYPVLKIEHPLAEDAWEVKDDDVVQIDTPEQYVDLAAIWGSGEADNISDLRFPLLGVKIKTFHEDFFKVFHFPRLIERKEEE